MPLLSFLILTFFYTIFLEVFLSCAQLRGKPMIWADVELKCPIPIYFLFYQLSFVLLGKCMQSHSRFPGLPWLLLYIELSRHAPNVYSSLVSQECTERLSQPFYRALISIVSSLNFCLVHHSPQPEPYCQTCKL